MEPLLPAAEATTAQNIATKRKTKRNNITGELATLSDKFGPIYSEVQDAVTREYEQQEDKLQNVEDWIIRLQQAIMTEQQRRVIHLKTVEKNLDTLYSDIQKECHEQVDALRPEVPARLAAWHVRIDKAHEMLEEEKEARKIVINRERLRLLKVIDDFEKQLEIEKVERLAREVKMVQQVNSDTTDLQKLFDTERARREAVLGHERDENDQIDAMRDKPSEIFKEGMIERMIGASKGIRRQTAIRLHAEQQYVAALESYTKSLQTGLRMVNKPPPKNIKYERPSKEVGSMRDAHPVA